MNYKIFREVNFKKVIVDHKMLHQKGMAVFL